MKKLISTALAVCVVLSLTACGSNTSSLEKNDLDNTTQAMPADTQPASAPTTSATEITNETLPDFQKAATIEETVLVDENNVKITASGLSYSNYSADVELLIENNSPKDLQFVCESLGYSRNSVNGYIIEDGYLNCDVAAGKKATDTVSFAYDALRFLGIQEIADIELGFDISDDDHNDFYTGPRQIKTSAFESHDYSCDYYQDSIAAPASMNTFGYQIPYFSNDIVYEENGLKGLSTGLMINKDGEPLLSLELENITDESIYVEASDVVINNLAVYDYACENMTITPGKRGIMGLKLSSVLEPDFWDIFGIHEISSVTMSLQMKDEEWNVLGESSTVYFNILDHEAEIDHSGTEVYNQDGVRILAKAVVEDPSEYSKDIHVLLLAENTSTVALTIDDVYDSLSVNDFMTDYYFHGKLIESGQSGIIDITLREDSLEQNKIAAMADITSLELGITIKEGRETIAEPTLKITY